MIFIIKELTFFLWYTNLTPRDLHIFRTVVLL